MNHTKRLRKVYGGRVRVTSQKWFEMVSKTGYTYLPRVRDEKSDSECQRNYITQGSVISGQLFSVYKSRM